MTNVQTALYSVSQLINECDQLLKSCFGVITVQGEISNLIKARSGHWYFSLKDAQGAIRCACFKHQQRSSPAISDGQNVIVTAQIGIYQARGDFQLIVESIKNAGDGALKQKFEQLKQQLQNEGLFDSARKQPLAKYPKTIGVITSATGAAIRDILTTLNRRCPHVHVILYPSLVQGQQAAQSLCHALDVAEQRQEVDVIILSRGGGSLEDLWPFNEACLAYQMAACAIPIITGVGHEVDTTIADLVADHRAATPTAAAELTYPDQQQLKQEINHLSQQLSQFMRTILIQKRQDTRLRQQQLQHPKTKLQQHMQTIDLLLNQCQRAMQQQLQQCHYQSQSLSQRIYHHNPSQQHNIRQQQYQQYLQQLSTALHTMLQNKHHALAKLNIALDNLSPSKILCRGYTITSHHSKPISSATQAHPGDALQIQFHDGTVETTVNQ